MGNTSEPEMRLADKRLRIYALLALAIIFILGLVALGYLLSYVQSAKNLAEDNPHEAAGNLIRLLLIMAGAASVFFIIAGSFLAQLSLKAIKSRMFPPEGTRVIKDTKVVRGDKAQRIGLIGMTLALLLLFAGIVLPAWVYAIGRILIERTG